MKLLIVLHVKLRGAPLDANQGAKSRAHPSGLGIPPLYTIKPPFL